MNQVLTTPTPLAGNSGAAVAAIDAYHRRMVQALERRVLDMDDNSRYSLYYMPKSAADRELLMAAGERLKKTAIERWPSFTADVKRIEGGEVVVSLVSADSTETAARLIRSIH